jgi:hypothetical protein
VALADSPERGAYHAHDGWEFQRLPDGSVRLTKEPAAGEYAGQMVTFSVEEWASIVASVSVAGETAETWRAAERAHMGVIA